jgi:hypothetical protein
MLENIDIIFKLGELHKTYRHNCRQKDMVKVESWSDGN